MKEKELREKSICGICGKKIGSSGLPTFWTATFKRYGLNAGACQRQQGLEMMIGAELGQVMGTDEELADQISEKTITVCEACASKEFTVYEVGLNE